MIIDTATKSAEPSVETLQGKDEARLVDVFRQDVEFLRLMPMFSKLEDVELARLCQVATVRKYDAGSVLLEEGRINDALYMVRRGSVELNSRRTMGQPFLTLGRGRFFGQVSMFDPAPASASVVAKTNVEVMCLRERPLCDLLIAYPEVGLRLMAAIIRDLAKRYHTMVRRVVELTPDLSGLEQHHL